MIRLALTLPYLRLPGAFTSADYYGTHVVHHDFIEALLRYSDEVTITFFLSSRFNPNQVNPPLEHLRKQFPQGSVEVLLAGDIEHRTRETHFLFSVPFEGFHSAALARQTLPSLSRFPIHAITHTLPDTSFFWLYAHSMLWSEQADVLSATSAAARTLLKHAFDAVEEVFKSKWRSDSFRRPQIVDLPLGIFMERFRTNKRVHLRESLGLTDETIVGLFIGRLDPEFKADLMPLLVAVRRLKAAGVNFQLILAGRLRDDAYLDELSGQMEELEIGNNVTVVPNFLFEDKHLLYSTANIFVSPVDNVQETFGLVIIEAMAAGLPVVASDWSGYRDLVHEGENGFLIPTLWDPAAAKRATHEAPFESFLHKYRLAQSTVIDVDILTEKLRILATNAELRQRFGEKSTQLAEEKYSWSALVPKYVELWRNQLVAAKDAPGDGNDISLPDFNAFFSGFATQNLEDDTLLYRHKNLAVAIPLLPSHIKRQTHAVHMEDILSCCESSTQTLGALKTQFGESVGALITWLLKIGALSTHKEIFGEIPQR